MLGVLVEEQSYIVGDNSSVVSNTTIPSSTLSKKNQACNFHRIRECIIGGFIIFAHINTHLNVADMCTKPLNGPALRRLLQEYLFRKPDFKMSDLGAGKSNNKVPKEA